MDKRAAVKELVGFAIEVISKASAQTVKYYPIVLNVDGERFKRLAEARGVINGEPEKNTR